MHIYASVLGSAKFLENLMTGQSMWLLLIFKKNLLCSPHLISTMMNRYPQSVTNGVQIGKEITTKKIAMKARCESKCEEFFSPKTREYLEQGINSFSFNSPFLPSLHQTSFLTGQQQNNKTKKAT
jgi:hypothetical protein